MNGDLVFPQDVKKEKPCSMCGGLRYLIETYEGKEVRRVPCAFCQGTAPQSEVLREGGLTLRDYFAAQALIGLLAQRPAASWSPDVTAKDAYELAEAMLKERHRGAQKELPK